MMKTRMILFPLFLTLAGCASLAERSATTGEEIAFHKVDSPVARVGAVDLVSAPGSLRVRGELTRKRPARGAIPGHLHIDLSGEGAVPLAGVVANYRRLSVNSQRARFSEKIIIDSMSVKRVAVSHHAEAHPHPHP